MSGNILGLHHVTATVDEAQPDLDFTGHRALLLRHVQRRQQAGPLLHGIHLAVLTKMSNPTGRSTQTGPRGPEGVPVDAPGNDAPAISPHAVSRMHRAEDDPTAIENSPEFTDQPAVVHPSGHDTKQSDSGAPASDGDNARRVLPAEDPKNGRANPSHDTHKSPEEPPRGLGDGELMEQPDSVAKAQEPGAK